MKGKMPEISQQTLLIVDDEPAVGEFLKELAMKSGYQATLATNPETAFDLLNGIPFGVILSDYVMPKMDGIHFLEAARVIRPDAVQILMTGQATLQGAIESINRLHLFGYLPKPAGKIELLNLLDRAFQHYRLIMENRQLHEVTRRQNLEFQKINETLENRVRRRTDLLNKVLDETIIMLSTAAEEKDDDTGTHIYRIKKMTDDMCTAMSFKKTTVERIGAFSILHDIGKIHIPDDILKKPGKLTDREWEIMKRHTTVGERILGSNPFYAVARQIARSHHENWDGSGYPDGLQGKKIPLPARIVAIADMYDALINKRPYKAPWSVEKALEEIVEQRGKKFEPDLADLFVALQRKDLSGQE